MGDGSRAAKGPADQVLFHFGGTLNIAGSAVLSKVSTCLSGGFRSSEPQRLNGGQTFPEQDGDRAGSVFLVYSAIVSPGRSGAVISLIIICCEQVNQALPYCLSCNIPEFDSIELSRPHAAFLASASPITAKRVAFPTKPGNLFSRPASLRYIQFPGTLTIPIIPGLRSAEPGACNPPAVPRRENA